MPVGTRAGATSGSQSQPVQRTSSSSGPAGEAGLHQVPVAEQHGVGDRAQEGGADEEAGDGEPGAGSPASIAGGDEADHADGRRDQVERGWELGHAVVRLGGAAVDAGHGRHPGGARLGQRALLPATPARRRTTRHDQRRRRRRPHAEPTRGRAPGAAR